MAHIDQIVRWYELNAQGLPLCLSPADLSARLSDLIEFVKLHRDEVRKRLARAGAILLRGFEVRSVEDFAAVVAALVSESGRYSGGDARRTLVSSFVYTANDTTHAGAISPHNEMGYSRGWPEVLLFYCRTAPATGGETPLTDGRALLQNLSPQLLDQFRTAEVVYIQNLPDIDNSGVECAKSWRKTFETEDRAVVDRILAARRATWWWTSKNSLHLEEAVPAFTINSITGEEAFFCQANRWHISHLVGNEYDEVSRIPPLERYHHCLFSNGTDMSEVFLTEMARKKNELSVRFGWNSGDVLLIENAMVLHGRSAFSGRREVYVSMGTL